MACGILVPKPGIEPMPPEVDVQSLNHWIAREVPIMIFKINSSFFFFLMECPMIGTIFLG